MTLHRAVSFSPTFIKFGESVKSLMSANKTGFPFPYLCLFFSQIKFCVGERKTGHEATFLSTIIHNGLKAEEVRQPCPFTSLFLHSTHTLPYKFVHRVRFLIT